MNKRRENSGRVAAAAYAGDHVVRKLAFFFQTLLFRFVTDDGLEVANNHRKWMGTDDRTDDVMRVLDAAHPVAHRFISRVLEGHASAADFHDARTHELHAGRR